MEREHDYDRAPNSLLATINETALNAVSRTLQMLALRKVRVQLDDYGIMPERAHETDAGADIFTPVAFVLPARGSYSIKTGVHIQLPPMTKCELRSKSGLNVKGDIISRGDIISEGLIDEGFSGEIVVRLHNLGDKPHYFERGDKITQLVVTHVYYPEFEEVEQVEGGERGENGYGSTGR